MPWTWLDYLITHNYKYLTKDVLAWMWSKPDLPRYDRQISSIIWRIRSNPNCLGSTTLNSIHSKKKKKLYKNLAIKSTAFAHPTGSPHHTRALRQILLRAKKFVLFFAFAPCSSNKMKWCQGLYTFMWVSAGVFISKVAYPGKRW